MRISVVSSEVKADLSCAEEIPIFMRLTNEITLLQQNKESQQSRSEVVISGTRSGHFVSGSFLEAAVRCRPGWLIFVTDKTPSEEMLAIHFIGDNGALLDSARVGGPYSTGSFEELRLVPPAMMFFRFIDEVDWSVEVFDRGRLKLPWWPDAKGVWRGSRPICHFRIKRHSLDKKN